MRGVEPAHRYVGSALTGRRFIERHGSWADRYTLPVRAGSR